MQNITLEASDNTPHILLDHDQGLIEFSGKSYPENTFDFYRPILEWIKAYFEQNHPETTTVSIKLTYFNSATTQTLFDILDIIQDGKKNKIIVNWYYDKDNENSIEDYEDYSDEFPDLHIQPVAL